MKQDEEGPDRFFDYVSDEIKRKHHLLFEIDSSHDTKIGIFLGFLVLILVEIIISQAVINSVAQDISSVVSRAYTFPWVTSIVSLGALAIGMFLFVYAAYVGRRIYSIHTYEDASTDEVVSRFFDGTLNGKGVNGAVAARLLESSKKNRIISKEKADGIKKIITLFFLGMILLLVRFGMLIILTTFNNTQMTKDQEPQKPQPPKKPIVPGWDAPAKPEYIEKADKRRFTDLRKK